jgi:hypothetical protein
MRQRHGVQPFASDDPDSSRIWWDDAGVHQNLAFPPHPDPVSGAHAWHQRVKVEPAHEGDCYGDISVDTNKSFAIYRQWLSLARPAPGPRNQRRPQWLLRPCRPAAQAFEFRPSKDP